MTDLKWINNKLHQHCFTSKKNIQLIVKKVFLVILEENRKYYYEVLNLESKR